MRLTSDGDWMATVTGSPLRPRFDIRYHCVRIAEYADVEEWQRFLVATLGSQEWLWDTSCVLRVVTQLRGTWPPGRRCLHEPRIR
jgi:hypothetical protein